MRIFRSHGFHRKTGRDKALGIVAKEVGVEVGELDCSDGLPDNCNPYFGPTIEEPVWCVFAPWGDGRDGVMLRSSRIVLVSKRTGKILFDGSALDEG